MPSSREPLVIHTRKGNVTFMVEIADTPAKETRGLMFRRALAPDRGMLFLFNPPRDVAMWMKNTLIPLDMFFIAPSGQIVRIAENTTPESLAIIRAGSPVAYVLEAPGGTAKRIGSQAGDWIISKRLHK